MDKKHKQKSIYLTVMFSTIIVFFVFKILQGTLDNIGLAMSSLRPVFIGIIIAYIFRPLCNKFYKIFVPIFEKNNTAIVAKKKANVVSMILTYIIWIIIIFSLLSAVLPTIVESIVNFVNNIPNILKSLLNLLKNFVAKHPDFQDVFGSYLDDLERDMSSINTLIANKWTEIVNVLSPYFLGIATGMVGGVVLVTSSVFNIVVGFIISIYLLIGRKKLGAQSKLFIRSIFGVKTSEIIFDEVRFADKMFSGYFIGSILDSILVGIECFVGCLIFDLPYAILIAVLVGVTNIIPFFGPYIGLIPSTILILTVSPIKAVIFVLMILVIQQIDGNIIAPKIIGSNTGLSSFWVLFSILTFGGMFGAIGMVTGVPVFAVIFDICNKIMRSKLKKRGAWDYVRVYDEEYKSDEDDSKENMMEKFTKFIKNMICKFKNSSSEEEISSENSIEENSAEDSSLEENSVEESEVDEAEIGEFDVNKPLQVQEDEEPIDGSIDDNETEFDEKEVFSA